MKNIIWIVTLFLFLGCKKQKEETKLQDSKFSDINQIVEVIINQDSLYISKNDKSSIAFCIDLVKINIQIPIKNKEKLYEPPTPFNSVSINQLLSYKINNDNFFSKADSTYLVSQSLGLKEFKIEQKIIEKIKSTTFDKEELKQKTGKKYDFYEMTIPVFSKDNSKAYVEINHYCGGLCGSGKAFFLSKINGEWRIINKTQTWIS
ncbi:hypothetical protein [Flavobacterium aestivum]|uniref:hypothetical protein n=1 Tax=Flavobacterium aestivum TaxID=3003257 RepID=UPI002285D4A8|nr:hypothetical protein [Flavobacterium aestivum]